VVITPQDEKQYYDDTFVVRFRQLYPNRIVPTFEQAEPEIIRTLTETKIALDIDAFLESARERSEIVVLSQV
jgi:hypothetical protein